MLNFTKMEGTGNDFIIIDNTKENVKYDYKVLVKYLCDRNFGVGADGTIFVEESDIADFKMRIFNKDGTEAEMCGNGIRCLATYIYTVKEIKKTDMEIETLAGIKDIKLIVEGKRVVDVIVNMGSPELDYKKIPIYCKKEESGNGLEIENFETYPISMGNPHAVCFVENVDKVDIKKYGELIENYKYFPNKTNVEFVEVVDKRNIKLRVWERGVGETLSCGTGACSAAVISYLYKDLENKINVKIKGGRLTIRYNKRENIVWLQGEANIIFSGQINI